MATNSFTHPIIKGEMFRKMLPEGIGLVLEGGGTRGFYTAGVFEAFMDEGIMFPYIVAVSAGAANAYTYVSGQKGRNRLIVENYVADKRYLSFRNMFRYGSFFGYKFIFDTIPNEHVFFDYDVFIETDTKFLIGTLDCKSGESVWFEKKDIGKDNKALIASCSVPFVAPIVNLGGRELLDGGMTNSIPIDKSIADGNHFHVIILTQNIGFVKKPFPHKRLARFFYRKYPHVVDALFKWHDNYNRQLKLCEELEAENKAIIIRPQIPLTVSRLTRDTKKLLALYDEGHREGAEALKKILDVAYGGFSRLLN